MTEKPLITVNKARFDIFKQYKNESKRIRGMISKLHRAFEGGEGGRGTEIEAVARLLLGPDSYLYRVFFDHLRIPHPKFAQFMATFLLVCRINTNLGKLWEDDDFNTDRYLAPTAFNRILQSTDASGLNTSFSLCFWEHLETFF